MLEPNVDKISYKLHVSLAVDHRKRLIPELVEFWWFRCSLCISMPRYNWVIYSHPIQRVWEGNSWKYKLLSNWAPNITYRTWLMPIWWLYKIKDVFRMEQRTIRVEESLQAFSVPRLCTKIIKQDENSPKGTQQSYRSIIFLYNEYYTWGRPASLNSKLNDLIQ